MDDTLFTSMGMFIIDEIHFPAQSGKPSQYNVIGGGGTYGALGSRIVTPEDKTRQIGWIVDKGSDFLEEIERYIRSWETGVIWRSDESRLTTRGWNMYGERQFRSFKYLTEKKRIVVEDLIRYEQLLYSESYHLICSPKRSIQILDELKKARSGVDDPVIVWEPVPDLCLPETLDDTLDVLSTVNVLTPNAEEAARFFGMEEPTTKEELEALASKFIKHITSNTKFNTGGGIVLRCGELGSYTLTSKGLSIWLPPFHTDQSKVVDPTGAGNTFIGAFTTGFVLSGGDWTVASVCGNIGAGVAIEQIGMPAFGVVDGVSEWNGRSFEERLRWYVKSHGLDLDVSRVLEKLQRSK